MSAPIFLGIEQIYDLIAVELPDGVYSADRADNPDASKRSYSSSELRAHAAMFAQLYGNLENIYKNKFISTIQPDGLAAWEKDLFAAIQDSSLSFMTRQQNLLAKIRAQGGINYPAIYNIIAGILTPAGLTFDLLPLSGQNHNSVPTAWVLDYTPLDIFTYLSTRDPLWGEQQDFTPLDCTLDYVGAGITLQDLIDIQLTAYAYEVRIYGIADDPTLALLDKQLTKLEPARSDHIILNNVSTVIDPSTEGWNTNFLPWWTT